MLQSKYGLLTEKKFKDLFLGKIFLVLNTNLIHILGLRFLDKDELYRLAKTSMAATDYIDIYIRKLPFNKASIKICCILYMHELLHIVLRHDRRAMEIVASTEDKHVESELELFNIAADNTINHMILEICKANRMFFVDYQFAKRFIKATGVLLDPSDFVKGPAEILYRQLRDKRDEIAHVVNKIRPGVRTNDCGDTSQSVSHGGDRNEREEPEIVDDYVDDDLMDLLESDENAFLEKLEDLPAVPSLDLSYEVLLKASILNSFKSDIIDKIEHSGIHLAIEKACGNPCGNNFIKREIERSRISLEDLSRVFFDGVINKLKGYDDKSYLPYDINKTLMMSRLLNKMVMFPSPVTYTPEYFGMVIDASGSITEVEMFSFIKAAIWLFRKYKCKVRLIILDDRIFEDRIIDYEKLGDELTVEYLSKFVNCGQGGTDLRIGCKLLEEDRRIKDYLVFTDGFTPWIKEDESRCKVFAVIYEKGNHTLSFPKYVETILI